MSLDLFSDTHMHSTYSDGCATIAAMAEAAFEKGFTTIAITDHVPLPFDTRYAMKMEQLTAYRKEITRVKRAYDGRMAVKTGLEIEYIPGHKDWLASIASMEWDLTIASVHTLVVDSTPCLVNGNGAEFHSCLDKNFNKDIRSLCRAYYQTLQEAVQTGWFDIVGHLDVLKKYNIQNRFFNETDAWYRKLVEDTLDAVRDQKMKLEINMGAMAHPIGIPYPSPWIVKSAQKKKIALVMGSDAHHPGAIGKNFDRIQDMLA
ncbi:MAG: histidinol-phosphatase HisJ [Desulfotignum sp.]|jgi:histidinol-phosphatase (PHP family)|nr:histidinol-phosphatase HisJ [Desulfotignum sp.]